jgi:hypothetical protein
MRCVGEFLDNAIELVDDSIASIVGCQPLVVRVGPFAGIGVDPVVVYPVEHLLAIDFEIVEPAGKRTVYARFTQRVADNEQRSAILARRVVRLVVFCPERVALLPTLDDRPLPHFGYRIAHYMDVRHRVSPATSRTARVL